MNRIKELRTTRKMTQKDLSIALGIAQPTLSGWETGRSQIDYDSLKLIAAYFNVSLDYLLKFSDEPNPPQPDKPTTQQPIYPQEVIDLAEKIQHLPPDLKGLVIQQIKVFEAMEKK